MKVLGCIKSQFELSSIVLALETIKWVLRSLSLDTAIEGIFISRPHDKRWHQSVLLDYNDCYSKADKESQEPMWLSIFNNSYTIKKLECNSAVEDYEKIMVTERRHTFMMLLFNTQSFTIGAKFWTANTLQIVTCEWLKFYSSLRDSIMKN